MSPGPAASPEGYRQEAVKTIDDTSLLIPSQLPEDDGRTFMRKPSTAALTTGLDLVTSGSGGQAFLQSKQKGLTGQEVAECAQLLGIDVIFDTDLLYIAEELLTSVLPEGWERYTAAGGKLYYYCIDTRVTQWAHPLEDYYRSLVFMRKEGDTALEKKALDNPPTPDEVREMAKYMGIDYRSEFGLLDIAKAAVNAPLPPEWEEFEDENGEMYYLNKVTKQQAQNHPLDGFFIEVTRQRRFELQQGHGTPGAPGISDFWSVDSSVTPYPWMEFVDRATGALYYYNFAQDVICDYHPCHLIRFQIKELASVCIQAVWRGFWIRHSQRQLVLTLAAKDIQRLWKGHKQRKTYKSVRDKELIDAATVIQSLFRGRKVRVDRFMQEQNTQATLLQAKWRSYVLRKKLAREAAKYRLPEIPGSVLAAAPTPPPELSASETLARVAGTSRHLMTFEFPEEPALESVDANGDPMMFTWLRIEEPKPASRGSIRRNRPSRRSQGGSRESSRPGSQGVISHTGAGSLEGSRRASLVGAELGTISEAVEMDEAATEGKATKGKKRPGKKRGKSPGKKRDKSPGKKR